MDYIVCRKTYLVRKPGSAKVLKRIREVGNPVQQRSLKPWVNGEKAPDIARDFHSVPSKVGALLLRWEKEAKVESRNLTRKAPPAPAKRRASHPHRAR